MNNLLFFFLMVPAAFAQNNEGYPPNALSVNYRSKAKEAFLKNSSCFQATVFVNSKDISVLPDESKGLGSASWNDWTWLPGSTGDMSERSVASPVTEKSIPDFGPDIGTHTGSYFYSYDFFVPQGTKVWSMEGGVVVRIKQHYRLAHQDKSRMDEVNQVEVLHSDGSLATYAHLKENSVPLKLCQKIEAGSLIGLSGHNGYSQGPHLHVGVSRPVGKGKFHTISLRFLSK